MGRRKKTDTIEQDIQSFTVTKDAVIEAMSKDKIIISQDIIAKFDIKPVGRTNKFAGRRIMGFTEKSYEASLIEAYAWRDRENAKNGHIIELVDYYPQEHMGKNILVSYNIHTKEVNQEEQ